MANHAFAVQFTGQVDKAAGIIRGVSVITAGVAKGHNETVDAITISQVEACAKQFAGGLKVVDRHTRASDSIFSTAGTLRNFRIDGGQLRADLYILSSEPNRDKLLEMAETMPDTFGISIAFSGPTETRDGTNYARCTEIYNAALVDVPAANPTGLFSAQVDAGNEVELMNPEDILKQCAALIASATTELSTRLKAAEDKIAGQGCQMAAAEKSVTELTAKLEATKTELAASITTDEKKMELTAQVIAKEFAKHTGQGAAVKPDGAGDGKPADPKPAEQFVAKAVKHFSVTKSKTKALELAMTEDPEGYRAYRSANIDIKWA